MNEVAKEARNLARVFALVAFAVALAACDSHTPTSLPDGTENRQGEQCESNTEDGC